MGVSKEGVPELLQVFYRYGISWEVIPCVIFLGLGAMTDFEPLIANPKTLLVGAGAQLGGFLSPSPEPSCAVLPFRKRPR